jgi:uncharacterized protein (TIGR03435 family)
MRVIILIAALAATVTLASQEPAFDVVSIKTNVSGDLSRMGPTLQPSGRVFAVNVPLQRLVQAAYGVEENEIVGGPAWLDDALFDVEARAGSGTTPEQARTMMRALLAGRFGLTTHAETRQLPIFELQIATRDGKPAAGLRRSGPQCAPPTFPQGVPLPPPPPPSLGGVFIGITRRAFTCPTLVMVGNISARSMSLDAFAEELALRLRRPVVNRTGLSGAYDFELSFAPEHAGPPPAGGSAGVLGGPVGDDPTPAPGSLNTGPSLMTALQEQLGLKLESGRGPVQVLVIDRAERPTEN